MDRQRISGRADFAADLRAEHAGYQQFLKLLESERDCLSSGDAESLLALSREKSERVLDLVRLGECRARFLRANHHSADRAGMSDWLDADAGTDRDALHRVWNELIVLADQARTLSEVNGALITTRLVYNQKALDALSGMLSPSGTYGPDGHTETGSLASHLGTA